MISTLKRQLYFIVVQYFAIWAKLLLRRWKPAILVVTGSSGKTTMLHMLESQLGEQAKYSHDANSAYGICFDILGLHKSSQSRSFWLKFAVLAPLRAFSSPPIQKIYVVEADADRSGEAAFTANLLRPQYTIWLSSGGAHAAGYEAAVHAGAFSTTDEAIAAEYAEIAAATTGRVFMATDKPLMQSHMLSAQAPVTELKVEKLENYQLGEQGTMLQVAGQQFVIPSIMPRVTFYQIAALQAVLAELQLPLDASFANLRIPAGRASLLAGQNGALLLDSSYNNASVAAVRTMLELLRDYPHTPKWVVLGDILEQGSNTESTHVELAALLNSFDLDGIVLVGRRVKEYTYAHLSDSYKTANTTRVFDRPDEALQYLQGVNTGHPIILFKGALFFEGIIAGLLANEADAQHLVRRGTIWDKRRAQWGV